MPPYAYHVTTSIPWKGLQEKNSNVFHYNMTTGTPTEAGFLDLAGQLVNILDDIFASPVKFVQVRVHGPTNTTKAEDQMRAILDLANHPGVSASGAEIGSEEAIMAQCFLGRGPKGGKQYLRKFFHTWSLPGTSGGPQQFARGVLPQTTKDAVLAVMNQLNTISVGGVANGICAPSGKMLPAGATWQVNNYIVGRQFRRRGKRRPPDPATV